MPTVYRFWLPYGQALAKIKRRRNGISVAFGGIGGSGVGLEVIDKRGDTLRRS